MTMLAMIASAREGGADAWDLIAALWGERGLDPAPCCNAGQVALAKWIAACGHHDLYKLAFAPSYDLLGRLLTGEAVPGDALAEFIARATDGAVAPELWAEPIETPAAAPPLAEAGGAADPSPRSVKDRPPLKDPFQRARAAFLPSGLSLIRLHGGLLLSGGGFNHWLPDSHLPTFRAAVDGLAEGGEA